jgi:PPM family protein phosphatase
MLRVAEHWHGSDVGRQRSGNEDALYVRSPLFVLADGMGGAQAGEVASELAVRAFRDDGLPEDQPERWLVSHITRANGEILDASRSEAKYQGMGTTCTTAYVAPDEVVLAHVGDSRCYLLRDGELTKLTRDHSLIGELIDRGKLTDEEAQTHPQRSVITRALGIERDLIVDTERMEGRPGDVYLICSDGLTDMVREPALRELLVAGADGSLADLGRRLIGAANDAGGRDNITVILFRLEEVGGAGGPRSPVDTGVTAEQAALAEQPTGEHDVVEPTEEQRTQTMTAVAEPEAAAAAPVVPERTAPPPAAKRPPKRTGRRRWMPWLISGLVVLSLIAASAFIAVRAVFFVGTDANRSVVIYRGLPFEGPFGIRLWSTDYTSGVTIDMVPAERRDTFTNQKLRSFGDAVDLVEQLETGSVR